jgi:hypothetical protein
VLVIHGRNDRIVSFSHGEALAAARDGSGAEGGEVRFLPLECGHNDCPPPGETWWTAVRGFLVEAGVLPEEEGG